MYRFKVSNLSCGHCVKTVTKTLQSSDPSAEVRRNLLLNLPLTKEVLPYLLERARDADATTRRALYARLLPTLGDFRHLSLTHREKLLRWGLKDRDENVRKATARLFRERWIEDCAALPSAQATGTDGHADGGKSTSQTAVPSLDALHELLERIDVVNSGGEGGICVGVLRSEGSIVPEAGGVSGSCPANVCADSEPVILGIVEVDSDAARCCARWSRCLLTTSVIRSK